MFQHMCVCVCDRERLSSITILLETGNIYRYDSLLKIINLEMVHNIRPEMSPSDSIKVSNY